MKLSEIQAEPKTTMKLSQIQAPEPVSILGNLPESSVASITAEADEYNQLLSGIQPETAQEILEVADIRALRAKMPNDQARLRKSVVKRLAGLERVRQVNPIMADEIENMGSGQANLIAMGEGFASIGRGLGLMDKADDQQKLLDEGLRAQYPMANVSKAVGQAAPFAPLGVGAGLIPSTGGRIAAMGGIGALEGGLITKGEGGDLLDTAVGAGAGAALGAGGELAIPYASRAARRFVARLRGEEPPAAEILITPQGQPTPTLQNALDEAQISFKDMLKQSESPESVTQTVADVSQVSQKSLPERLNEIVAASTPSQTKVAAAQELGLDQADIPPGVLTDSPAFAQVSGALSAVPGSVASEGLDRFTNQLSQKADDIITEMGGSLDKGQTSTELRERILNTRDTMFRAEGEIYDELERLIPKGDRLNTALGLNPTPGVTTTPKKLPTMVEMEKEAAQVGGFENLDKYTRKVYSVLRGNPTYAKLDAERKAIGSALNKKGGYYSDAEEGVLKKLYGQLTDVQGQFAGKYADANEVWAQAKQLTQQRKALEENSQILFGRDMAAGIIPSVESGLKRLPSGDYKKFDQMMQALPKEERPKVLATALNGIFTSARSPNQSLTATQYTKWFDSLKRSPQAYQKLQEYLPPGGMKRLENLNAVAEGLAEVTRNRTRTGIVKTMFDDLDKSSGWVSKLYNLAETSPIGVSQTLRVTSNIAKMAAKEKDPAVVAADRLLSSDVFKKAFYQAANDPDGMAARQAQAALKRSGVYRHYLKKQPRERQETILALGFIPWLLKEDEQTESISPEK